MKEIITNNHLQSYKSANELVEILKSDLFAKRLAFEEIHLALISELRVAEQKLIDEKEIIKTLATEEYLDNGNKNLLGGISIRSGTTLKYDDIEALTWARINMPVVVKEVIDKKTFESFAKTSILEFVSVEEKITICFPKEINLK